MSVPEKWLDLGSARTLAFMECSVCLLVYDALIDAMTFDGYSWVTKADLQQITGMKYGAVTSALTNLQSVQLIEDTKNRTGGTGRVVIWKVLVALPETAQGMNLQVFPRRGPGDRKDPKDYARTPLRNHRKSMPKPKGDPRWLEEKRSAPDWVTDEEAQGEV